MQVRSHVAASLAVSAVLYLFTRSLSAAAWAFVGGVLIDLDHLYDYARHPRRPGSRFDLRDFYAVCVENRLSKVYVLLHSWELVGALAAAGWVFGGLGSALLPFSLGMAAHIALDALTNPARPSGYSIVARWRHGFEGSFFYRK